ncbi:MAG: pentapeptide repeat-containing protein, partial [Planctomycetota bacterium]
MCAKKAVKKVAKKTVAKKATSSTAKNASPKKAATKKATPKKKSASVVPELGKLFAGQSVCITGRYSYWPDKASLLKWLKAQGAKITETVDANLDVLVVGEGKQTAKQTKAEALAKSGTPIRIITDMGDLAAGSEADIVDFMMDPKRIKLVEDLFQTSWLANKMDFELTGMKFSKKQIGFPVPKKKEHIELSEMKVANCVFDACKLVQVSLGDFDDVLTDCTFNKCTFDKPYLRTGAGTVVSDCKGSVDFGSSEGTTIIGGKYDALRFYFSSHMTIENVTTKRLHSDYDAEIEQMRFRNVKAGETQWSGTCSNWEIIDFRSEKGKSDDPWRFEKSRLQNVHFKNHQFDELAFDDCDLVDCTFEKCSSTMLEFGNSRLQGCKVLNCDFPPSQLSEEQSKGISGPGFETIDPSTINAKQAKQLASTALQSDKLEFSFSGDFEGGGKVTV